MFIKRLVLGAFAAAISAAAIAAPASADPAAAVCTINGSATASVNWTPNTGAYNFGPTGLGLVCVGVGVDSSNTPHAATATVNATSAGNFSNVVCGTGTAEDADPTTIGVVTTDTFLRNQLLNANLGYSIVFAAGTGALTWGNPLPRTVPTETGPVGGGAINISPWTPDQNGHFPGTPPGECTNGFNVAGVVAGVLA
jgi:hypothetical protein